MSNEIATREDNLVANIVLKGDLSGLNPQEKVEYYNRFCESLGLNPLTRPFDYIRLSGKETLYAKKDATEQLRKIHGVSVTDLTKDIINGVCVVTAKGQDKTGRTDTSTGAVNIEGLKGDNLANALMKAETKAKRRLTLSICGLGILDETELETIDQRTIKEVMAERTVDGMEKGREEIAKLIEQYEPLVAPEVIEVVNLDVAAAKTVEDLRSIYLSLKQQGEAAVREEDKVKKIEKVFVEAYENKENKGLEPVDAPAPDGALSWDDIADEYDKTHSGRKARTLPMDKVREWASKSELFSIENDYFFLAKTEPDDEADKQLDIF